VLRIEDTDQTRFVPGAEEFIIESLSWCGIEFDEGVHKGGPYGPYRQSERKAMYRQYAMQLVESGHAYYAFDTEEELETMREQFKASGVASPQYNAISRVRMKNSLNLPSDEVARRLEAGEPYVIRFKMPRGREVRVQDRIRGLVVVQTAQLDDKVLFKSDGMPTYHLANVVDDHLMQITHVIRGEEWLPSAPLHILLYQAFGWTAPQFAHLPLLLKPEGNGKLSKRDADLGGFPVFPMEWTDPQTGAISKGFKQEGYLPEATLNFLAFLGWNPGTEQELFSLPELVEAFSLERINKAGAKFDVNKAKWFNEQYLKQQAPADLAKEYLGNLPTDQALAFVGLFLDRITFPQELSNLVASFVEKPSVYDETVIQNKWNQEAANGLTIIAKALPQVSVWEADSIKQAIHDCLEAGGIKMGKVMQMLRVALSGNGAGPDLMISMQLWGKDQVIERLNTALQIFPKL